jgi:hypothetical protein
LATSSVVYKSTAIKLLRVKLCPLLLCSSELAPITLKGN